MAFEAFARDAAQAGRTLCGAVPSGGDDPFSAPPPAASVIVIGAEGTGLPAGAYRYLDRRFTIPMAAPVDSLNAAVAAALLLYASRVASSAKTSAWNLQSRASGSRQAAGRQTGLPADLRKKPFPVEAPLRGDLRKQQAAAALAPR